MKLTANQQQFRDHVGCNVLLSASAGSGKTSTMVAKLVKLITEHRVPIKNILTLTFTKSAANEMRQKLYVNLSEYVAQNYDEFVVDQIENINLADIGTIDSLCNKLVKKYFYVIGIDPTFEILDNDSTNYLLDKAIDNVFENLMLADDANFYNLYESYLTNRSAKGLSQMVKDLYDFLCVKPDYIKFRDFVINECYNSDIDTNICAKYLLKINQDIVKDFESQILTLLDMLTDDQSDSGYRYYLSVRLGFVREFVNCKTYSEAVQIIKSYDLPDMPSKRNTSFKELFKNFHNEFKPVHKVLTDEFYELNTQHFAMAKQNVTTLFDVTQRVMDEFDKLKANRGALTFNDLEHYTLKILQDKNIRVELQKYYQHVFFDEYQDINELQDEILTLIADDNLNLIGDVKQSIYEFRQSTPQLFVDKFNQYLNGNGRVINLNENFRSEDNILQFVNSVFNSLITTKTLGIDYRTQSNLQAGLGEGQQHGNNRVQMHIIASSKDLDKEQSEVNLILSQIERLVSLGYKYQDIAIILRNRGSMAAGLHKALKDVNVPCSVDYNINIFDNNEIKVMLSVMKVLNNYHDDISLATVLLSPIVGLTEADLVKVRLQEGDKFYQKVLDYNENDKIGQKIGEFKNFVRTYRHYLINHTVCQTMEQILSDYNLTNYYLSMPDGNEKLANIEQFLNIVSLNNDLTHALEYIDKLMGGSYQIKVVPSTKNCVTITTIHSSKGLEYKCVILAGLGSHIKIEKDGKLNISKNYGVGVKYIDVVTREQKDLFVKSACLLDKRRSAIEEEIRLLYVALTRAKEQLVLTGTCSLDDMMKNYIKSIYASKTYFDLILKSVPNTQISKFYHPGTFSYYVDNQMQNCDCFIYESFDRVQQQDVELKLGEIDDNVAQSLRKYYAYEYPYQHYNNVATKNTVTSILTDDNDYVNVVEDMQTLTIDSVPNNDSLELGNAYHAVMQNIDYRATNINVEAIISKLVINGIVDSEVAHKINIKAIHTAVDNVRKLITPTTTILKEQQFIMKGLHSSFVEGGVDISTLVQGVIDLYLINDGQAIVIDFKTNKTNASNLINTYRKQLELYTIALQKAKNVKVTNKLLYSFHLNKFVKVE